MNFYVWKDRLATTWFRVISPYKKTPREAGFFRFELNPTSLELVSNTHFEGVAADGVVS